MSDLEHAAERAFARQAIGQAAEIARGYFGRVTGTIKPYDPTQVLTEADLAVGRYLVDAVRDAYPGHNVVDEEAGVVDRGSEWTWVIDPIDGTSNFAAGVPLYGIFLGLLRDATPVVGAVALPASGDVYTAALGAGAEKNGVALRPVEDATPLGRRLICFGTDGDRDAPEATRAEGRLFADLALACLNMRTSGSAFDLAMVAEGRFGAVMYRVARVWDLVAPHVLLSEVGCLSTALDGRPLDFANVCGDAARRMTWCAAPPTVHAAVQAIVAEHPVAAR